ncbi:MAG: hypothetical protein KKH70_20910 [Gammaproteobacteria bacterium]|nr:hypothetical protein [Gammaproteobacteria bacterium]
MKQLTTAEQYFIRKQKGVIQKIAEKIAYNKKQINPDKKKSLKMDYITYNFCKNCLYNLQNNPEFPTRWEFKDLHGRNMVFTLTEATQLLHQSTSPQAFISNLRALYGDGKGVKSISEFRTNHPDLQGRNQQQIMGTIETYPGIEKAIGTLKALLEVE